MQGRPSGGSLFDELVPLGAPPRRASPPLPGEGSTGSRRAGPCRAWGPMFCTSAAPRPTARRAPGSGRVRITFCPSVTNAAGPGNDLLMTVSDEDLLVASVGDEEAFAAFYRRNARPLA